MTIQLFKWMMALAIMIYMPLLFERLRNIRRTDTKHSEEYIRKRVEGIYFDVTHFYNQLGALRDDVGEPEVWPDFDRLYCSDAWNEALGCTSDRFNEAVGNYWLAGYSSGSVAGSAAGHGNRAPSSLGFLYANKVEVIDHTGDQGTASLVMHNGDEAVPVLLNMVYERDDWFIDDMTFNWNVRPGESCRSQLMALRS